MKIFPGKKDGEDSGSVPQAADEGASSATGRTSTRAAIEGQGPFATMADLEAPALAEQEIPTRTEDGIAHPLTGGSFIRQPDGTLTRQEA